MPIHAGSGSGGSPFRKKGQRTLPVPPQKSFRPIENPFPQKEDFRAGLFEVLEVKDDYLICRGYDPNAKNPLGEYNPAVKITAKVAKPPLLMRTPWDGNTATIDEVEYSYEYSDDEMGVRTKTWTDDDGDHEEEERIDPPYFVGDIIEALKIGSNQVQHVMEVNETKVRDEDDALLEWMDQNISGRRWESTSEIDGSAECVDRSEIHQYTLIGSPTGGTFDLTYRINSVPQILTFNWDDTSTEVQATMETHSEVNSGDVSVSGGPFPNSTIEIVFEGDLAGKAIQLPTANWASLTGGDGKAAIGARVQTGYPN